jgi:hypothetical protein
MALSRRSRSAFNSEMTVALSIGGVLSLLLRRTMAMHLTAYALWCIIYR